MSLPTTRDETIVAGGPISHTLINRLQDQVVGANHGVVTKILSPFKGEGSAWARVSVTGAMSVAGINSLSIPLDVRVGDLITGFAGWGLNDTSAMTLKLRKRLLGQPAFTALGTTGAFGNVEVYQAGTITSGEVDPTVVTVVPNTTYWLEFESGLGNNVVYGASITYQHIG